MTDETPTRPNVAAHMTLHRYFLHASRNRSLFNQQLSSGLVDHPHTRLHMEEWYAFLFVVIEGWKKEKLQDPAVTAYFRSPRKLKLLENCRNAVFHYSRDYIDKRFEKIFAEADFVEWVCGLHDAISSFFLRT